MRDGAPAFQGVEIADLMDFSYLIPMATGLAAGRDGLLTSTITVPVGGRRRYLLIDLIQSDETRRQTGVLQWSIDGGAGSRLQAFRRRVAPPIPVAWLAQQCA